MDGLALRRVVLAVADAGARRHALHVARPDHRAGADRVLMLERAFQHVRDDLHVAVAVGWKAAARRNAVVIDHPQRAEPHVGGVVVLAERERVAAVEPAEIGTAAVFGFSQRECHRSLLPASASDALLAKKL
jgi:hypothetical protein